MRNLVLSVAALAALALCACGASSKEVAMAKTARYQGDKLMLFAETKVAVEAKYEITVADEAALGLQSKPRWYTPEGLAQNDTSDISMFPHYSLNIAMAVQLLPEGESWIVKVTPRILRYNKGIPKPEPVKEGDYSLPNWVQSRTDELALAIHNRLSKYEVKSVPQQLPAGNEPPPAAPGQTPPAPAAEGSAAPATP